MEYEDMKRRLMESMERRGLARRVADIAMNAKTE
jgi:hypothetical protein